MQTQEMDIPCITSEDIQPEVDYWKPSIVGFVIGANPPGAIMDGFFRRIWKEQGIDKVITIDRGMFLIRFKTMEQHDKILAMGRVFFDYKPVILKAWHVEMELSKKDIQRIPIWIQLDLFFKDKLQYARCMIEVKVDQNILETVNFKKEKNGIITVSITYEWKLETCKKCKKLGHSENQCYVKEANKKKKKI
ncbi:tRNA-2-methylthio-N(6)-dimethylallyladenosine synthase [Bienertia sinuspersici]